MAGHVIPTVMEAQQPTPHSGQEQAGSRRLVQRNARARRRLLDRLPLEELDAMSREDRLARDRDLVRRIQLEASLTPPADDTWRQVIWPELYEYAVAVLPSMLLTGRMFEIRARRGRGFGGELRLPDDRAMSYDDAYDIAADVAIDALPDLQRQLLANRWKGDRPDAAALRSWFVTLCCFKVARPYNCWLRDSSWVPLSELDPDAHPPARGQEPSAVIYDLEFERHLTFVDDDLDKEIIRLDADGWRDPEIAVAIDETVKVVEYRLAKARRAARRRRDLERRRDSFREFASVTA